VRVPRDGPLVYISLEAGLTLVRMSGVQNDQTLANAGPEANLNTQFGLGMLFLTPGTFFSTGASPPFAPDVRMTADSNEPYDDVRGMFSPIIPRMY